MRGFSPGISSKCAQIFQFLEDAVHGIAQPAVLIVCLTSRLMGRWTGRLVWRQTCAGPSGYRGHNFLQDDVTFPADCPGKPEPLSNGGYRVALGRKRVQLRAALQRSGSMRTRMKATAKLMAAQIRKMRAGLGCPRCSMAYCARGCRATPMNESRLAVAM